MSKPPNVPAKTEQIDAIANAVAEGCAAHLVLREEAQREREAAATAAYAKRTTVERIFSSITLVQAFGREGAGLVPIPSVVERAVARQYGMRVVGRLPEVRERFYAISAERRLKHPAVVAISSAAKRDLFG